MTAKKHLKMTNPGEVRRAMTRVSNMVLNGEITPQQANALIYAGNAVLSSIRADEQERRLTELERKLDAQTAPAVLLIETENGSQRMTVSQYNAAGGMLAMPIWKNPEALNLRAARQLLAAVPSVIR